MAIVTTVLEFEAVNGYGRIVIEHTDAGDPDELYAEYREDEDWQRIHEFPIALVRRWFTSNTDWDDVESDTGYQ